MPSYWIRLNGTEFPIRREQTLVGRSAYCSIVLTNKSASRQHCVFQLTNDGLILRDLSSRNGTWVNGELLQKSRALKPGDQVRIGSDTLEVFEGVEQQRSAECSTMECVAGSEDSTSHGNLEVVDLLESLTSVLPDAPGFEATVRAADAAFATLLKDSARDLDASRRDRVEASAQRLSLWFDDGSRREWLERVRATLRSSMAP